MDRNIDARFVTKECIVARWLWGSEYARQHGGQVDFYERLNKARKQLCKDFLTEIERCERRADAD